MGVGNFDMYKAKRFNEILISGLWLIVVHIFAARAICAPQPDFFDSILQSTSVFCPIISK